MNSGVQKSITKQLNVSHLIISNYDCEWVIKNFSHFDLDRHIELSSPVFHIGKENECKLSLKLETYKSGNRPIRANLYSKLLLTKNEKTGYCALIRGFISNDNENSINFERKLRLDNEVDLWFLVEFKLFELFPINNNLVISLTISVYDSTVSYTNQPKSIPVVDSKSFDEFEQLLEEGKFGDFTLLVGGKEFKVYKGLLAARSRVFAAMFEHQMTEVANNSVEIKDVKSDVMKEVLRFIYSGKVNDLDRMAEDIWFAADKYDLIVLKNMCEVNLIQNLNVDNLVDLLILADRHQSDNLKSAALEFLTLHSQEVIHKDKFQIAMKSMCTLVGEILSAVKT